MERFNKKDLDKKPRQPGEIWLRMSNREAKVLRNLVESAIGATAPEKESAELSMPVSGSSEDGELADQSASQGRTFIDEARSILDALNEITGERRRQEYWAQKKPGPV